MKTLLKSALVASLLIGSAGMASAAVHVGFDLGNVAVGYNDGYMDNDHHFHRWAHRRDMSDYRSAHADGYHGWRHNDRRHHD
jgi:hypothetical protein